MKKNLYQTERLPPGCRSVSPVKFGLYRVRRMFSRLRLHSPRSPGRMEKNRWILIRLQSAKTVPDAYQKRSRVRRGMAAIPAARGM